MAETRYLPALPLASLRSGEMQTCELAGREVLLCHTREGIYAVDDLCTHAEARLSEGRLRGTRILCPLHGASFDVRDGRVLGGPATRRLPTYPVRVREGTIEVAVETGEREPNPE